MFRERSWRCDCFAVLHQVAPCRSVALPDLRQEKLHCYRDRVVAFAPHLRSLVEAARRMDRTLAAMDLAQSWKLGHPGLVVAGCHQ